MIPIHPVATSNPQQLCWVVPPANLPPPGIVRRAPGRLGEWLDSEVINEVVVRTGDVLISLTGGTCWRDVGDEVRDALAEALSDLAGWVVDGPDSDRLTRIATELLDGPIGKMAESHGGSIQLVSVSGDNVTVRMSGACRGCPASGSTLYDRLQRELRRRVGDQVTVTEEAGSAAAVLGRKLRGFLTR